MRRVLFCAILFVFTLPTFGDAAKSFALGRAALESNNAESAASHFETAVAQAPRNAEYQLWLGRAYGTQAQAANPFKQMSLARKTRSAFEKAVELDPNLLEARFALIDYYLIAPGFMGGDEEKAVAQSQEIRKRDALGGHRAFARIYMRQKKVDLARKEYVDGVREQPNSAQAHYQYGLFLFGNDKNYKVATDEMETAIRLDPAFMPAYFRLGQLAAQWGVNFTRGEEALRRYLQHKPGPDEPPHNRTWYWLGTIQEKQGKKGEARQSFQTSLRLAPKAKEVAEALKRVS